MKLLDRLFRDKHGRLVIWQAPNIPLAGWIIFTVISMLVKYGRCHSGAQSLADASLITWAYLEIRTGANIFRKVLGTAVLAMVVIGFFRR